jgi:hypothetical protein
MVKNRIPKGKSGIFQALQGLSRLFRGKLYNLLGDFLVNCKAIGSQYSGSSALNNQRREVIPVGAKVLSRMLNSYYFHDS